jgi:GT2 family glycosyltransferase
VGDERARVSVLIPTWNNASELVDCLESLRRLDYPKSRLEVLVFDNGSTDGTASRVRAAYGRMRAEGWGRLDLVESPENLGAFGGRAAAFPSLGAAAEFVLSLDDDVELEPDALAALVDAMADSTVGVVGARIVYHDAPDEVASGAGYLDRLTGTFRERIPAARTECDFVSSCGCLIRRVTMDRIGGFEGDYFTSHGDVDLCLKAKAAGFRVLWEPAAVIRHKVARGGTRTPERVYYGYRNKLLLLRRHLPRGRRPWVFLLYGLLWVPKTLAGSVRHHRRLCPAELRAIVLAAVDGALGRRGRARWFGR